MGQQLTDINNKCLSLIFLPNISTGYLNRGRPAVRRRNFFCKARKKNSNTEMRINYTLEIKYFSASVFPVVNLTGGEKK